MLLRVKAELAASCLMAEHTLPGPDHPHSKLRVSPTDLRTKPSNLVQQEHLSWIVINLD